MTRARPRILPAQRAFTLAELVVVVVILAIAAVAVVPRLGGTARQEASNAVDRVAELVRLFAYREALGSQQVALWRDGADGRIHLIVKDRDPENPDEPPDWRADRFAAPVTLPEGLELVDARIDDRRVDPGEWNFASVPGGTRPKIELRFSGHGVDSSVVLPSGSPSVFRVDADKPDPFARDMIDLDRTGRDDEPW